jgi:hypothetical protein
MLLFKLGDGFDVFDGALVAKYHDKKRPKASNCEAFGLMVYFHVV